MALTKERIGEIAYLLLKEQMRRDGLRELCLNPNTIKREVGNKVKTINNRHKKPIVNDSEILEFGTLILTELVTEFLTDVKNIAEQGESV